MNHMRVLEPADGVLAFYDGRIEGYRFAEGPNWVDDGALSLGIASYAVVREQAAVVYDTHVSVDHALRIRQELEGRGVSTITVVLSHWHLDHVAGTAAFSDCEIVSSRRTRDLLSRLKGAIERGSHEGPPAIDPLLLATRTFEHRAPLALGSLRLEMIHTDIHSDDATVLWLADQGLLLCGDTLEDTVTYVDEPRSFGAHLTNLERLRKLAPDRILPNHGDPEVIAGGGYGPGLIDATEEYIRTLQRCRDEPALRELSLRELLDRSAHSDEVNYFAPYETVHRHNVETVLAAG